MVGVVDSPFAVYTDRPLVVLSAPKPNATLIRPMLGSTSATSRPVASVSRLISGPRPDVRKPPASRRRRMRSVGPRRRKPRRLCRRCKSNWDKPAMP